MTDKKSTTPNTSSDVSSELNQNKTASASSPAKKVDESVKSKPAISKKASAPQTDVKTSKSSLPVIALILAIIATIGIAGLFYWQNQQQLILEQNLLKQSTKQVSDTMHQVQKLLKSQQAGFDAQLAENVVKVSQASEKQLLSLKNQVDRLSQNQPSDWLLHEAEYLIRIAARTIWLEKDTHAAINLLQDANNRIQELNDPHYLPLRQVIHDDIEALKLLPSLATQEVVLTLISLNKHINELPLSMAKVPQKTEPIITFELSEDANDWKANLKKTWDKFLKDFITVSRRTGDVEPLLSPQYQQNLRENLSLKLQLAQWAAIQENADVYLASLNDIQTWVQEYFSAQAPQNLLFIQEVVKLKSALITYKYPSSLESLQSIRNLLQNKNILINTPKSEKLIDITPQLKEPSAMPSLPILEVMEGA